jgi:hypothetical protein
MKWTGVYLIGYVILMGGLLAALWKMGILASIGTAWTLIGCCDRNRYWHHARSRQ